jgi:hypothetical protein
MGLYTFLHIFGHIVIELELLPMRLIDLYGVIIRKTTQELLLTILILERVPKHKNDRHL